MKDLGRIDYKPKSKKFSVIVYCGNFDKKIDDSPTKDEANKKLQEFVSFANKNQKNQTILHIIDLFVNTKTNKT